MIVCDRIFPVLDFGGPDTAEYVAAGYVAAGYVATGYNAGGLRGMPALR